MHRKAQPATRGIPLSKGCDAGRHTGPKGGQFDPATAARGAEALQRRLPGSRLLTFAGRGHGLMARDLCAIQAAADFVDNPASLPHAPCADRPAPDFLLP